MLILISIALLGVGLLLFSLGVAIWLVGLTLRIAIRLFQLALLIVLAGVTVAGWLKQRPKADALDGEILPAEQRALPSWRRHLTKLLLMIGVLAQAIAAAHADDWRQRAQNAVTASADAHQPCVLYADQQDGRLHIRIPVCLYDNGDIYLGSQDGYLTFNGRKAGATLRRCRAPKPSNLSSASIFGQALLRARHAATRCGVGATDRRHGQHSQYGSLLRARTHKSDLMSALIRNRPKCCGATKSTLCANRRHRRAHSINLSARASSVSGIVRPKAFAVSRLITKTKLVGCSMGRSPGFATRKIFASRCAACR